MIITKKLTHKLLITAFVMITMTSSYPLHAMESASISIFNEASLDADFQAYLVLSTLGNDHQCYLFPELVQVITTNVSKLIDKECYDEYGKTYLNHPNSLVDLIKYECDKSINHISIANLVKRCLRHSCKSLGEIKSPDEKTAFHQITYESVGNPRRNKVLAHVEWIKILCLVAGNEAWNIICIKDKNNYSPLHSNWNSIQIINALLSVAPNSQSAWNLIITPDIDDETVLDFAQCNGYTKITELLESYRPKEQ